MPYIDRDLDGNIIIQYPYRQDDTQEYLSEDSEEWKDFQKISLIKINKLQENKEFWEQQRKFNVVKEPHIIAMKANKEWYEWVVFAIGTLRTQAILGKIEDKILYSLSYSYKIIGTKDIIEMSYLDLINIKQKIEYGIQRCDTNCQQHYSEIKNNKEYKILEKYDCTKDFYTKEELLSISDLVIQDQA